MTIGSHGANGIAPIILSLLFGCAPTPYLFLQYGKDLKQADLGKVVADNPLGATENIKNTTLGQGQGVSHHVVQIRDREPPHIHRVHDATVVLTRGRGYLIMDNRRIELSVGDIVHIPRGVGHYFVNTAPEPAVAFVIFSPPFDGKDTIPLGKP